MRREQWLEKEMAVWREKRLVDDGALARIRGYYASLPKGLPKGRVIFAVLGALLIGLGVIALLAANWESLSRPVRTAISFAPLALCVLAYFLRQTVFRRTPGNADRAFFEPLGVFWGLAVGAAISLVAQTYHISGDVEAFILTWTLLLLPVVYATRAVAPAAGYFGGLLAWISVAQCNGEVGVFYWPLALLALPLLVSERRANPAGIRVSLMEWSAILCSTAALGISLEKCVPGLWMFIYSGAFSLMLLHGFMRESRQDSLWQQPCRLVGGIGLAAVLFMLTEHWPWEAYGWNYYRDSESFHAWAAWFDYILTAALPVAVLAAMFATHRALPKRRWHGLPLCHAFQVWAASPFVVAVAYIVGMHAEPGFPADLMLVYFFVLGLATLGEGIAEGSLAAMNIGTLVTLSAILSKFFSEEWSFTVKGCVFIAAGVAFMLFNLLVARRLRKAEGGAK
jgi:hypothetical protein